MTLAELRSAGFQQTAVWRAEAGDVICRELHSIPDHPGLYLFCVETEVRYVGAALGSLRRRMGSYQRRQLDNQSKRPVHTKLKEAIRQGHAVHVYTRNIDANAEIEWDRLRVSVILGAEAALIKMLAPKWNRRGRIAVMELSARPVSAAC